jgi:subtilase family serine protease
MRHILSAALLPALAAITISGGANARPIIERSGHTYYVPACNPVSGLEARCSADIVTDRNGHVLSDHRPIGGYAPAQLLSAYNIPANAGNASTIIAIVDAYGYDKAESDLAVYRSQWGLTACTTKNGCFSKLNQDGKPKDYPAENTGWALAQALDLDMASAICPGCTIYLFEAKRNSLTDLAIAVDAAAGLGAHVISNSYCAAETQRVVKFAKYYHRAGVAITAPNGLGFENLCFPGDINTVVGVGGTTLTKARNTRGWKETVWSGSGSGCSALFRKPKWQRDPGCSMRTVGDTSADSDPDTGVAVYDSYDEGGWLVIGGTSVAVPLIGGVFGVNGGKVNAASTLYADPGAMFDITTGSNGTCSPDYLYLCNGEVGYDAPSGAGTPNGPAAFGN